MEIYKVEESIKGWLFNMALLCLLDILILRQPIEWGLNMVLSLGSAVVWYWTAKPRNGN